MKRVTWTQTYRFCAGHRLHDPHRDERWNLATFGKCSYPGGHGHNYTLELSVRGEPDPATGRVVDPRLIDAIVKQEVFHKLDHRSLNDALSTRYGPAPTTEVLVLELWDALQARIPRPAVLHRLKVSETARNSFEYHGPEGSR